MTPLARVLGPALVVGVALSVPGCGFFAPSVSVERAGPATVYARLNRNILNSGELSSATREVLHAYSLTELADDEPRDALRALHEAVVAEPTRVNLFALSELAYALAGEEDDRDSYLASAVYAWLYLFSTADPQPPNSFDRRFRWACDLYNAGVQRAFVADDGDDDQLVFQSQDRELPVGRIQLVPDVSGFPWVLADFERFVPGDDYVIEGLSLRMRDSGLGVPLIAIPVPGRAAKTPASALLRVNGELADMQDGLTGQLALYSVFDAKQVQVGDVTVPLESDVSVALAYSLNESPMWKFSLTGLFQGDRAVTENKLIKIRPYQPGRIPVVFVHGTASNPAYWAEMFNTLLGDPELREGTQFWFYQYASGNPILYSASGLRDQLRDTIAEFDPEGQDPALRQIVLIGHSQGGLLVKLMLVNGSLDWINDALGKPVDQLGFDTRQMELLRHVYEFAPSPDVARAIFLCTPQRGSFLSDTWFAQMTAKFIAVPGEIQGLGNRLFSEETQLPPELAGRMPTSLDNMSASNPMLKSLIKAPISPSVTCHSIIAIGDADARDAESLAEADDGVVAYSSAHIEGVASELLVSTSHSCQDDPRVIQEVRRILHEALAQR